MSIEKALINPVKQGGAPVFVSDLLRIQENSKVLGGSFLEYCVLGTGSPRNVKGTNIKYGVWVVPPELISLGALYTIGDGLFFVDGELIYFPGGAFDFSSDRGGRSQLLVGAGDDLKVSRVFKDGLNKEFLITKTAKTYTSGFSTSGDFTTIPPEVDRTKQYVQLMELAAPEPTIKRGLGIESLEARVTALENA